MPEQSGGKRMEIRDNTETLPVVKKENYLRVARDGAVCEEEGMLLSEHHMTVRLWNQTGPELVCTPQYLAELVLGHLYAEGLINGTKDIQSITISRDGALAEVVRTESQEADTKRRSLKAVSPIPWEMNEIVALADCFAKGMPLHAQTWATHSCFLMREGELIFSCEDIGRHNAFDKVIGYALRHEINLRECIVYTSGRTPTDMVKKAIYAGIPVLAAKAVPTAEAVHLAQQYHLTLLGAARCDRMRLFTNRR